MRPVPTGMQALWEAGDFLGDKRAFGRVTIQRPMMATFNVNRPNSPDLFATLPFQQADVPRELKNVKSISWDQSIDADAATCTVVLFNVITVPAGSPASASVPGGGFLDVRGAYAPNFGGTDSSSAWGHVANAWSGDPVTGVTGWIAPDRVLRTFQGYGLDASVIPELDANMVQTGTWLIDDVDFSVEGIITITCRDFGRLLIDQIMYPPVIPLVKYPLQFFGDSTTVTPDTATLSTSVKVTRTATAFVTPTYQTSSNIPYVGNNAVFGHYPKDAFDASSQTYWLSIGNAHPNYAYSYEWIQGSLSNATVKGVKFTTWAGPYTVYIGVLIGGVWQGAKVVPYDPNNPASAPNGSDEKFVATLTAGKDATVTYNFLNNGYTGVDAVRLTFTNLYNSGLGTYPFRAGVRTFQVVTATTSTSTTVTPAGTIPGTTTTVPGNYTDYSEIVKYLLACGGFYWPQAAENPFVTLSDITLGGTGTKVVNSPPSDDPYLVTGRVWGDIEMSGTYGPAELGVEIWDKKPLMDGIRYVADILGFRFWVNEEASAVFRMPNIWTVGNFLNVSGARATRPGPSEIYTINESNVLLDLKSKLSSRGVREQIFIANVSGTVGAVATGYNPAPAGFRRVSGWCVDTETEIFTRRGWLHYDEVQSGDETLSIDAETGIAEWQRIDEVAVFEATDREMIEFTANNFSAVATLDHQWLVERYDTQTKTWTRRYVTSAALTTMDRIPRACVSLSHEPVFSDAIVELVAWTYTEGSVSTVGNYQGVDIYQHAVVNFDNCERIRGVLKEEFDTGWSEHLHKGCIVFGLSAAVSRGILPHLGPDKAPTMEFLTQLTQQQLDLFIEVSCLADGHVRHTSEFSKRLTSQFYQNVGPRLDAFLAACALAGRATSYHVRTGEGNWHGKQDLATVTVLTEPYYVPASTAGKRRGSQRRYTSNETVWCPTMPKHHNWLARHGGSVFYTGNSDQNFIYTAECQIMADLISVRQMFNYRTDSLQIPGFPGIQIDDQVHIVERVTGESYLHYVKSISSNWDVETGVWTYDLGTHWLGKTPDTLWFVNVNDPAVLNPITHDYLAAIQAI